MYIGVSFFSVHIRTNSRELHSHSYKRLWISIPPSSFSVVNCQLCRRFMSKLCGCCSTPWSDYNIWQHKTSPKSIFVATRLSFHWSQANSHFEHSIFGMHRSRVGMAPAGQLKGLGLGGLESKPQRRPPACGQRVSRNDCVASL